MTLQQYFDAIENNDDELLVSIMDRTSLAAAASDEELKCTESHFGNAKNVLGDNVSFDIVEIRHYSMTSSDLDYINADYASKLEYDFRVKSAKELFFEIKITSQDDAELSLSAECNAIVVQEGTEWHLYFLTAMLKSPDTDNYIGIDKFPLTFETE